MDGLSFILDDIVLPDYLWISLVYDDFAPMTPFSVKYAGENLGECCGIYTYSGMTGRLVKFAGWNNDEEGLRDRINFAANIWRS